jgi:hypothetical protein
MSFKPPSAQIAESRDIEYRSCAATLVILSVGMSATVRSASLSKRQYSVANLISASLFGVVVIA